MPATERLDARHPAASHAVTASAQHSSGATSDGDSRSRHGVDGREQPAEGADERGPDERRQSSPLNATPTPRRSSGAALAADFKSRHGDSARNGSERSSGRQLSNQQTAVAKPGSASGEPESRAQRLKNRVLTGCHHTASTKDSNIEGQRTGGSFVSTTVSRKPLQLKTNLDELGKAFQAFCVFFPFISLCLSHSNVGFTFEFSAGTVWAAWHAFSCSCCPCFDGLTDEAYVVLTLCCMLHEQDSSMSMTQVNSQATFWTCS